MRAGCPQRVGGFVGVLMPGGKAARTAAASWRLCGGVEAVRAGCPQRVGGFVEVLRPCGQVARSELEALWRC